MPADAYSRMNSSNSENGAEKLSTSPSASSFLSHRIRTDSESSDRQTKFLLPGSAGSPPKVLTLDEVQKVVTGVENMALAHEIAINPNFRLEPYEPPENSLEKNVREMLHKAFWDLLRQDLAKDPPCYDHAIRLLGEIKEDFTHLISANNEKALKRICEVLDSTVIRQQAEQGVLDFKSYASFIIQIMALSCAPIRDEEVAKLNEIEDVVDTFHGILKTMRLMKLDMANCLINVARKDVIAHSVEYEKEKFKEFLDVYTYGFPATEAWLLRHKPENESTPSANQRAVINAYIEFLDWNFENKFPEIMSMDSERIFEIAGKALQLCVCACIVAILQGVPVIGQNNENKKELIKQIQILLQGANSNKDIEDRIENVSLQVKTVINAKLTETGKSEMDEQTESTLKSHILQIAKRDSPVRSLMCDRLNTYAKLVLSSSAKSNPSPPPGYTDFADELAIFTAFKGIVFYNFTVFGEQYYEILSKAAGTANETKQSCDTSAAGKDDTAMATTTTETPTTSTDDAMDNSLIPSTSKSTN